jgi:hypothetical protein
MLSSGVRTGQCLIVRRVWTVVVRPRRSQQGPGHQWSESDGVGSFERPGRGGREVQR